MGVEIPLKGAARENEERIVGDFVGVESLEHSHAGLTDYLAEGLGWRPFVAISRTFNT